MLLKWAAVSISFFAEVNQSLESKQKNCQRACLDQPICQGLSGLTGSKQKSGLGSQEVYKAIKQRILRAENEGQVRPGME